MGWKTNHSGLQSKLKSRPLFQGQTTPRVTQLPAWNLRSMSLGHFGSNMSQTDLICLPLIAPPLVLPTWVTAPPSNQVCKPELSHPVCTASASPISTILKLYSEWDHFHHLSYPMPRHHHHLTPGPLQWPRDWSPCCRPRTSSPDILNRSDSSTLTLKTFQWFIAAQQRNSECQPARSTLAFRAPNHPVMTTLVLLLPTHSTFLLPQRFWTAPFCPVLPT